MSKRLVTKRAPATACDLCGKEIPETIGAFMTGSIIRGYVAPPVTPKTKRAWLTWPPRDVPWFKRQHPELAEAETQRYDFHAECIVDLVERNLFNFDEGGAS